jgi:putative tryptophan/tyrosine transport system substrate-binding protein
MYDRFDALAAELVEAKVDVIFASVPRAALAAKRASAKTPVVVGLGIEYLVGAPGLVDNLSRPGGNITGLSSMFFDLAGKQLEILKDCVADLSAVALLFNANLSSRRYISETQKATDSLGISLHVVEVRSPDDLDRGFSEIGKGHVNAVLLTPDPMFVNERRRIAQLALAERVPIIAWSPEVTEAGALMSYGANTPDLFRRAANYIDKILKGASPGDLPIEQPVKFDFAINLRTAKTLGLTIPPSLLVRATEVIE